MDVDDTEKTRIGNDLPNPRNKQTEIFRGNVRHPAGLIQIDVSNLDALSIFLSALLHLCISMTCSEGTHLNRAHYTGDPYTKLIQSLTE